MGTKPIQLHAVFFPFMAHGHMIPTLDMARMFSAQGIKATIISTPLNISIFTKITEKSEISGAPISIEVFELPSEEVGLPKGLENLGQAIVAGVVDKLFNAGDMLREQLEKYLEKTRPNFLVADMFFPWATQSAAKFNIPRLVFHGISLFAICTNEVLTLHQPQKKVASDTEPFILPYFPHEIRMTRLHIHEQMRTDEETEFTMRMRGIRESELNSYGVLVNSFSELEPDYVDFFRKELMTRAWYIGPVSTWNRTIEDKIQRGKQTSIDENECLKWLSSKRPHSVIYISFGSMACQLTPQLHEIATALETSGQEFIWVIRNDDEEENKWFSSEFEKKMKDQGLIIKGWAPQLLILEHEAIGGFVTHCGWNSVLEAISAGVPMVTWPAFAEQFFNEILVTQILKVGVRVGVKKWSTTPSLDNLVKRDDIEKAVREIMEGEEAEEMRNRANKMKEMAAKAMEEGGSSYSDLHALIDELRAYTA